jgi:hypothetical protein
MNKYISLFLLTISISSVLYSQPSLTTVILPQCIEGRNGTNTNRIPFAYRARLTGLLPDNTYRFYNQVVISSDIPTANGAGNCIFVTDTGAFFRTSSPGLQTKGTYDSLTTDGTGSYEGWFITEPTGAARLVPGRYIFMRILLNNGAGGTTIVTRLTTTDSVRVVKLDPTVTDSTGTGLRCTSSASPKDFVFLYEDTSGTGRPISGSFIESDGTNNTTNYTAFYANNVNGIDGAFGVILPNALQNGIQRIERRSHATGAIVAFATDADGIWPSGANTVNPSGGTTEIILDGTDIQWMTGVQGAGVMPKEFALLQNFPNPFNPDTKISYTLKNSSKIRLSVFDILGREVAVLANDVQTAGLHQVEFSANNLSNGVYFYRLESSGQTITKKMLLLR